MGMRVSGGSAGATLKSLSKLNVIPDRRLPNVVTALGDSRIAAIYLDPTQRNRGARSPLNHANARLGQRMIIGQTFGVSGDRTDQFFARLDAAIATGAGILYLQGGVNNIGAVASGSPAFTYTHAVTGEVVTIATVASVAARDIQQICDKAIAAGMTVVLENEVGASTISSVEKVTALNTLRQYIAAYAARTPGVFLHDAYRVVMQPSSTTPLYKTNFSYDGVHETSRGAYYHGKSLASVFERLVMYRWVLSAGAVDAPANGRRQLLTNHLYTTTTGGTASGANWTATANTNSTTTLAVTSSVTLPNGVAISGAGIPAGTTIVSGPAGGGAGNYIMSQAATATASGVTITVQAITGPIPSSWTAAVTNGANAAVLTSVANSDGIGNGVQAVVNFTGAGSFRLEQVLSGTSGGAYNANLAVGDELEAFALVEVVGTPSTLGSIQLEVNGSTAGSGGTSFGSFDLLNPTGSSDYGIDEACTLTMLTRPITVLAPTGAYPYMITNVRVTSLGAGSITIIVRQCGVRRRNG